MLSGRFDHNLSNPTGWVRCLTRTGKSVGIVVGRAVGAEFSRFDDEAWHR